MDDNNEDREREDRSMTESIQWRRQRERQKGRQEEVDKDRVDGKG